jgi:hypothetical protein
VEDSENGVLVVGKGRFVGMDDVDTSEIAQFQGNPKNMLWLEVKNRKF